MYATKGSSQIMIVAPSSRPCPAPQSAPILPVDTAAAGGRSEGGSMSIDRQFNPDLDPEGFASAAPSGGSSIERVVAAPWSGLAVPGGYTVFSIDEIAAGTDAFDLLA